MSQESIQEVTREEKEAQLLKSKLNIVRSNHAMFVIAVAVSRNPERNSKLKIPANKGVPIGGSVYDSLNQCYIIKCRDTLNIGSVGISFFAEMDGSPYWRQSLPVPICVLKRYLSNKQKYDLKHFEDTFASECDINFLQLINHNS
jgi:hypothetical protein